MSAFQLSGKHIATLVDAALAVDLHSVYDRGEFVMEVTADKRDAICAMLAEENAKSVGYRYGEKVEPVTSCFPFVKADDLAVAYVLKAIDCYEYQTCEHPGWYDSKAYAFCTALRSHLCARLPGYDDAKSWGIT